MITVVLLVAALCILGWGLYRSRSYGRLGILSWLQSLVVALPWIVFFGLSLLGIELNLIAILLLLLSSTGIYIWLGRQMRAIAKIQQEEGDRTSVFSNVSESSPSMTDTEPFKAGAGVESTSSNGPKLIDKPVDSDETSIQNGEGRREGNPVPLQERSLLPQTRSAKIGKLTSMPEDDLQVVKTIFSIDTFFSTEQVPYYNGAIFKGNLRGAAHTVHARLSERLVERMGTKYRLFMMDDPSLNPSKPIVVVLPSTNDPTPSTPWQWGIAGFLFIATILTCMVAASTFQGFSLFDDWSRWSDTMPLALGLVVILVAHEIGHRVVARQHNVRLGPPFLLPTGQIGSFGGLTRIESVIPTRTALFDLGFSGPAVGGGLSFLLLIVGLLLSHEGSVFQLSPTFFRSSILVGTLARLMLGNQLQNTLVDINPLVIVGWLGLLITAINVMPVGQLDGGRIVQAIYGRKILRRTSIVTLMVLAIATFVNPLALYWMIVILLLQRQLEQPQLNELTEPDDTRAVLGLVALFLMVAMLLPLSPELAARIGIGG